jgi:16S rRNA (uracil1498-N3)-methyltransferase
MPRLFVEPTRLTEAVVTVSGEDHRYLTRVLRVGAGDIVTLFDGEGQEADAVVTRMGPRALELKVELRRNMPGTRRPELTLIQGLTKGDKLDFIIQKATELGVNRILPVTTLRAVPRLETSKALAKRDRWLKIAREAARQCGRSDVPEVQAVVPLGAALAATGAEGLKLFLWEGAKQTGLSGVLGPVVAGGARPTRITLAVGPEGGFADEEVEVARQHGFALTGLGPRVLRTETAPLVALSILGYVLGDLG